VEDNLGPEVVHRHGDQAEHKNLGATNGVEHLGDLISLHNKVGLQIPVITNGVVHLEILICLHNHIGLQILDNGGQGHLNGIMGDHKA
jgi:hypothetical protein